MRSVSRGVGYHRWDGELQSMGTIVLYELPNCLVTHLYYCIIALLNYCIISTRQV